MSRIWPSDSLGDFRNGFFGFRLARISMYTNLDEVQRRKKRRAQSMSEMPKLKDDLDKIRGRACHMVDGMSEDMKV
jgi:hypothetical protein